ncbi:MAG: GYF domain-containing protein [Akkermansiaceae bacterium]
MADWFYEKRGIQYGPFDEATVRSRIAIGEIAPQDFVWREGMESWKPLQEVRDLYSKETTVPDSSHENGSPEKPSSISQDFSTPSSPQTPDDEKVVCCEPDMMGSVGPRAKFFIFFTKSGRVVVTNRRFLFLSEGQNGLTGQFVENVQEIDFDPENSVDIPLDQIKKIRVMRRWDFASYISIQGVDVNQNEVSYAFMTKAGLDRSKVHELVNAARNSQ